jgi:hypothetical protein
VVFDTSVNNIGGQFTDGVLIALYYTLCFEYLREFSKKTEMVLFGLGEILKTQLEVKNFLTLSL